NLVTLIQGEGLLNDATALTILSVAVAAAAGGALSFPETVRRFVIAAGGGGSLGIVTAWLVRFLRPFRADPLSSNALSLATPFAAYLVADAVDVSRVLAGGLRRPVVAHAGA